MAHVPTATYRFQLTPEFGFDAVVERLDHVARLGASHVYLSPIAQAVPESSHGYDVVDHTLVRTEFGGAEGFGRLLDAVAERDMAVVIDHVPNHMASTRPDRNPYWWALLRDGRGSDADRWFDVEWDIADDRVILPVLGAPLEEVIEDGHIVMAGDAIELYGERRLPLRSGTGDASLVDVLAVQHYVLQHWREPMRNVRRFFTIDDLVAVCVDDPEVAAVVDTLPARYASHAGFGGVRVDHVDGLADPLGYLVALRERIGPDPLIWVEKIVMPGEGVPESWPVAGTTGYEFARSVDHVLLASEAAPIFDALWAEAAGDDRAFHELETEARREVVDQALAPDAERVARVAARAVGGSDTMSVSGDAVSDAVGDAVSDEVRTLLTGLDRYRTYLPDDPMADALIASISDGPVAAAIRDVGDDPARRELRTRWQQLTGPVMAKGAEDRSFYRYLRLASLCEVGGDPGRFGISVDEFHADNERRQRDWPAALLAGSTHDTKRSEDVRARSAALTWWAADDPERATEALRGGVEGLVERTAVDPVTAWLSLQTALTTPGLDVDRFHDYLVKAGREAAVHTTWEDPDAVVEARLEHLATAALDVARSTAQSAEIDPVAVGMSLAATLLRLTAPGVPDVYQGAEAFTHRLVDPDNRVPPDWDGLADAVADERTVAEAWADDDPVVKTILIRTTLDLRRRRPRSFGAEGAYTRIDVGPGAIAFGRGDDVIVVVRRGSAPVAGTITFPAGAWFDLLDPLGPTMSGTIEAASAVGSGADGTLPIALFERE